ncbi:MAG TPA: hypothetical protein VK926_01535 [Gaiellaceae bacterium]|nr:hypothetical protein [Gaiellaceae bacterium]
MKERTSERVVGASGVLFVVGAVVGFGVLVGSVPGPGAEADEIREFLARSEARVWTGGYVGLLAQLGFLVFAAGLWSILRGTEGGTGWVSTVGLTAAAATVAVTIAADLVAGAAVFRAGPDVDPATASLFLDAKKLAEMLTVPLIGLFLASAAVVALRTAALPRWAGWSAALIAGASVVALPLGYEPSQIPLFLAALWILALSVRLLARPGATPLTAAEPV